MPCARCACPASRGDEPIREVTYDVDGTEIKIAVVNGLVHAKELIADVEAGKRFYHLVEVMSCQGGCVGGAGQPYGLAAAKRTEATASMPPMPPLSSSAPKRTPWSPPCSRTSAPSGATTISTSTT